MDLALFGVLTGLALADSLNPFTVASQAYLLGTPRPMPRSLAFLAGTYAAYFAGGVLLLEGWAVLARRVLPLIPAWGYAAGEVVLGAALGGFAAWSLRRARGGTPLTPPASLGIGATLAFAAASTAADLTSALPYFAAVSRIVAEVPGVGRAAGAAGVVRSGLRGAAHPPGRRPHPAEPGAQRAVLRPRPRRHRLGVRAPAAAAHAGRSRLPARRRRAPPGGRLSGAGVRPTAREESRSGGRARRFARRPARIPAFGCGWYAGCRRPSSSG